jgi:hypothetical protein
VFSIRGHSIRCYGAALMFLNKGTMTQECIHNERGHLAVSFTTYERDDNVFGLLYVNK